MENWNSIICSVLGVSMYFVNSALLPTWSHALVGIFSGVICITAYWLIGDKLKMWIRIIVSVVVAIVAAAIVRIFCV